jgi:UDP-N-acetylmuramoyl-tripeptide--D-alanyl-D-alanine ligase
MKNLIEKILSSLAAAIIKKYKPLIIAITGSAGKTSAREAILAAIGAEFDARASLKNYNNDLGLPLSVINAKSSGKNIFSWLTVIARGASFVVFPRHYPRVLILEMAADRPGDLARLVKIAPPDISVITSVGSAHIEFFGSEGAIAEEKATLVRALGAEGVAVLNADDSRVIGMRSACKGKIITFGIDSVADVRATKIEYLRDTRSLVVNGLHIEAGIKEQIIHFNILGAIGKNHVLAALVGLAVAKALKIKMETAALNLEKIKLAPGRSRLIPGIKETVIIDDSYNASPAAVFGALTTLKDYPVVGNGRRIAVLGDMLELGGYTEAAHRQVGEMAARLDIDYFYGVGERMNNACDAARIAGMGEGQVIHMESAGAAARFLQERLHPNDVVLIKGSQGMRMEQAVKELMLEPERAPELLCRQGSEWGES